MLCDSQRYQFLLPILCNPKVGRDEGDLVLKTHPTEVAPNPAPAPADSLVRCI